MSFIDLMLTLVAGLATVASLVVAFSWAFARMWCRPARDRRLRTPDQHGLPAEVVSIASHGVRLSGWFVPGAAGGSPWPAVVLLHGWSRSAGEMLPMAHTLNRAGFAVLGFDARGHGGSGGDGPITIRKLAEDVVAAVDYLGTRCDVDAGRLGVLGRSIGGSAALVAASMEGRVRAVASCAAFADPRALTIAALSRLHLPAWPFGRLACYFIERWLGTSITEVAPMNRIGGVEAPILLVHGEDDTVVPAANLDILTSRARRGQAARLLVPGRGHSDLTRDASVRQCIAAFFSNHLRLHAERPAPQRGAWAQGSFGAAVSSPRSS